MTLAGRDSGDLSMTFRDLKSFGARLSDLSRTLAGDPKMRVSDLKLSTLNVQLPVCTRDGIGRAETQQPNAFFYHLVLVRIGRITRVRMGPVAEVVGEGLRP